MQVLLKINGKTRCTLVEPRQTVGELIKLSGARPDETSLISQGRLLHPHSTVAACGLRPDATVYVHGRLLGGKPVKVHVITHSPNNKSEVSIDIEESASKQEVKQKLATATGIPIEHQKVVLSGIGQLAVGDKRSNIGFSSCGSTNGVGLAVAGSK
ncbi:hypothetical protein WJX84_001859 [Apatococcus fuscideae]|uniref:Ubiquitin-like domain-containing protein n=1 Tax=Apatococcus fuscideae TaxID=2026836 RepID=A0AAW1TEX9_9CHLO